MGSSRNRELLLFYSLFGVDYLLYAEGTFYPPPKSPTLGRGLGTFPSPKCVTYPPTPFEPLALLLWRLGNKSFLLLSPVAAVL